MLGKVSGNVASGAFAAYQAGGAEVGAPKLDVQVNSGNIVGLAVVVTVEVMKEVFAWFDGCRPPDQSTNGGIEAAPT